MQKSKTLRGIEATIDRMAQVMVEIGDGACQADLLTRGFTQAEVDALGTQATAAAFASIQQVA
jgi:hypothetical protein